VLCVIMLWRLLFVFCQVASTKLAKNNRRHYIKSDNRTKCQLRSFDLFPAQEEKDNANNFTCSSWPRPKLQFFESRDIHGAYPLTTFTFDKEFAFYLYHRDEEPAWGFYVLSCSNAHCEQECQNIFYLMNTWDSTLLHDPNGWLRNAWYDREPSSGAITFTFRFNPVPSENYIYCGIFLLCCFVGLLLVLNGSL